MEKERRAFIAALFLGEWREAAPTFLSAFPRLDLRRDRATFESEYRELLRRLTGQTEQAPPLGRVPDNLTPVPVAPLTGPVTPDALPPLETRAVAKLEHADLMV